ncbi:hypothetical protein [Mycobacterium tuberculosis]|uniref:hypothetical protein n=1 Tax=Mycobacterium tuberculosis TaxID=1773 RepID=UPI00272DAC67|nr:hypothetical protein [Mycobacterium tuberculosis]
MKHENNELQAQLDALNAQIQEKAANKDKDNDLKKQIQEREQELQALNADQQASTQALEKQLQALQAQVQQNQAETAALRRSCPSSASNSRTRRPNDVHAALIESEKLVVGYNLGVLKHENNELQAQLEDGPRCGN